MKGNELNVHIIAFSTQNETVFSAYGGRALVAWPDPSQGRYRTASGRELRRMDDSTNTNIKPEQRLKND